MANEESNPNLERVRYSLRAKGVPFHPPDQLLSGIHSRGYLPHVKREGASYFVTFRLVDSLPQEVMLAFKREWADKLRRWTPEDRLSLEEINRQYHRQKKSLNQV